MDAQGIIRFARRQTDVAAYLTFHFYLKTMGVNQLSMGLHTARCKNDEPFVPHLIFFWFCLKKRQKTLQFRENSLISIKNLNITEGCSKHPSISQFSSYLWHIWHFAQIWLKLPTVPPPMTFILFDKPCFRYLQDVVVSVMFVLKSGFPQNWKLTLWNRTIG